MNISKLENKIIELGGLKLDPNSPNSKLNELFINNFEVSFRMKIPDVFKAFYKKFGALAFNKIIQIKVVNIPISNDDQHIKVDYFYSCDPKNPSSIPKLINRHEGDLPYGFIPFCDGEEGDLFCISLVEETYGQIYYWWHECNDDKNLFFVSTNFNEFILSLEIRLEEDDNQNDLKNVKINANPKLMELLNKSGYGKKKDK